MEQVSLPISVVIPAYNAERFVGESLRSAKGQTAPATEIIVVDDGSTDGTAALAEGFGVRVIRQANQGLSGARNTAIRAAMQPWIALLDADDVWEPRKLARQWRAVEAHPEVGFVFCDFIEFDAEGILGGPFLRRKRHYGRLVRHAVAPGIMACDPQSFREVFFDGNFIAPSAVLARRDLMMRVGLFDTEMTHMEDREMWLRLLPVTRFAVVEEPLLRSRIHGANWSGNRLKMTLSAIAIAERIFAHPERYAEGAAERYRRDLPGLYLNAGRFAEEKGDLAGARRYFLEGWRHGGGLVPLARAAVTLCPAGLQAGIRMAGRRLTAWGRTA